MSLRRFASDGGRKPGREKFALGPEPALQVSTRVRQTGLGQFVGPARNVEFPLEKLLNRKFNGRRFSILGSIHGLLCLVLLPLNGAGLQGPPKGFD
jgi:hypothetical protein